ncbi:hypothetical protein P3T76_016050 [Phytophthora citrophthora]|uniref:Uncharacterized protein n=1 Tax=Phytophthora citrophthora TaxID=4793 RepID=A0AAD9FYN7_9STRA|nr:hypothetical protein P3T76_016050 [Phytophthora citrophthora]
MPLSWSHVNLRRPGSDGPGWCRWPQGAQATQASSASFAMSTRRFIAPDRLAARASDVELHARRHRSKQKSNLYDVRFPRSPLQSTIQDGRGRAGESPYVNHKITMPTSTNLHRLSRIWLQEHPPARGGEIFPTDKPHGIIGNATGADAACVGCR